MQHRIFVLEDDSLVLAIIRTRLNMLKQTFIPCLSWKDLLSHSLQPGDACWLDYSLVPLEKNENQILLKYLIENFNVKISSGYQQKNLSWEIVSKQSALSWIEKIVNNHP